MVLVTAFILRFWQLETFPPGLYRDEAFNGLDALKVLDGEHALFFTANNGREPAYIYLTALFISLFGRTITAVRLAAAFVGTLTTLLVFLLAQEWFGRRTGLLAAWLWAATLWTVHLSRLGLRPILLLPCLTLTFWLGTLAYRRQHPWLWLAAGLVYGAGFYTYLAGRFTPVLLGLVLLFMVWRRGWQRLWPGSVWFGLGTAVTLLPLALFYLQQPDFLLGRTDQVSIFNETINHGDLLGTFLRQTGRSLALFFWQGDTILRHNPAGRPVFDPLLILPFCLGLGLCLRGWRTPAKTITLLWILTMLSVTILAEDAPHFLRVVGILPATLFLPALGLNWLWEWSKVPAFGRKLAVGLLLVGSFWFTVHDYRQYGRDPETALMFEAAATDLAINLQAESPATAVYLDRWYWDETTQEGWPAIPYLAALDNTILYRPELGLPPTTPGRDLSLYAWQFGNLSFIPQLLHPPALVSLTVGATARNDLEENAYPLYLHVRTEPVPSNWPAAVHFGDQLQLKQGTYTPLNETTLQVDLYWQSETAVLPDLTAFVQLLSPDGVLSQADQPPGGHYWQPTWWQPDLVVFDRRFLHLSQPFDAAEQQIIVGLYRPQTGERLPIQSADERDGADYWPLPASE